MRKKSTARLLMESKSPPHTWCLAADYEDETTIDRAELAEMVSRLPVESDGLGLLYDGMEARVWPMAARRVRR